MSGVPYGAAMSGASGLFQRRGATFFLTCRVALWHKLTGEHQQFYLRYERQTNCVISLAICNMDPDEL